jgi:hypothetical protein
MLAPIHVENFEQLLGANGPICVHFTAKNCSYPLRRNWLALLQEALHGQAASAPKNIYNDLFIRDQNSILLAPVASDTSSAVRPKILAKWIDNLGWGVQPTSEVTKNLIKKADLFNLLILAKFKSDKLASETVQWFYNTLNRPDASDREPFPGGHLRPLGFNLADLVVNPWFDMPFITSMDSRNHALEDRLDQQLQKLQSKSNESQAPS